MSFSSVRALATLADGQARNVTELLQDVAIVASRFATTPEVKRAKREKGGTATDSSAPIR